MAETKSDNLPLSALEAALEKLTTASPQGKVTMSGMLKELASGKAQNLQNRIDRLINGSDTYFSNGAGEYQLRSKFFDGFTFTVTPDEWEIENGILIPGHRFAPFLNEEIFPSETILTDADGSAVETKEITAPLLQIFPYYMLLGSEQIFDVFMADSKANHHLRTSRKPEEQITVHVYDMKKFYAEHEFTAGDALLCTVEDHLTGKVRFSCLSGEERRSSELKTWITAFENAVQKEIDRFEDYLEIPDQIAWSFYLGGKDIPAAETGASLDEFIRRSLRIQIGDNGEHTVLISSASEHDHSECGCGHDHDHGNTVLPDGLSISKGETSNIKNMLAEAGSPLTPVEVDSFILDNCYARELEFEDFFARAFGREKLQFADEAQQIVFYNYIEERFEELTGSYNRYDDEPKAPIRSDIMELVEERMEFLEYLNTLGGKVDAMPQEKIQELAAVAGQLNEILRLLNDPGFTPEQVELEQLADTVENRSDDQDRLIAELTKITEQEY